VDTKNLILYQREIIMNNYDYCGNSKSQSASS